MLSQYFAFFFNHNYIGSFFLNENFSVVFFTLYLMNILLTKSSSQD